MEKVLIAMSGGVDSSVSAYLLKKRGFKCFGAMMKLCKDVVDFKEKACKKEKIGKNENKPCKTCCTFNDARDARSVAFELDIPFFVFNFTKIFENLVIKNFVNSYEIGHTPNPCIDCNKFIKFKCFLSKAMMLGNDYIATGHYARIEHCKAQNRYLLKKALDSNKDQSYFLYSMTQHQLKHTLFPIGELSKEKVREIAKKQNFLNFNKQDSQDICFVSDGNYPKFIKDYTKKPLKKGNFISLNGDVLGEHSGIVNYTIGQRKSVGISYKYPLYVHSIDASNNTVMLGKEEELYSSEIILKNINLIFYEKLDKIYDVKAKIRYRHEEQCALAQQLDFDTIFIKFKNPQRAITKGQHVVMYLDEYVLGGGVIS